ncbi:type II secretion system protein GspL [Maricaulis parjimensis]|uniref:type II secretion system protein GspL n=1 Tax=Maricaulis parjimensis TaxID=144023 RepID=UPI00193A014E|nr:type II secretion system protein GspL [Maricaulis parjimensis]
MSQDLILRLEETGRIHWSIIDPGRGERLESGELGADNTELPADLGGVTRTLVLLPAESVFLSEIDLPARGDREARQAAPFAIEDELASRLADTVVVPGSRQENGRRWVMAANGETVEAWQARITPLAVRPVHVLTDAMAGADPEAGLTLFDRGDSVLWFYGEGARAQGQAAGGALDPKLFGSVISPLVQPASEHGITVSMTLGLAGENFKQVPRGDLDLAASALSAGLIASLPPLLGERLLSKMDWSELAGPLKRPAALAAALLAGFCLLTGGEGLYYRMQADRFDEATVAEFRAAMSNVTRRVIPAEAERLLGDGLARLGGGESGSSFLQLSAALAELTADTESVRIDHVRFDRARSELLVSALYSDFADFETLNTNADALGIVLIDGGARQSGNAIEGEFTVRLR